MFVKVRPEQFYSYSSELKLFGMNVLLVHPSEKGPKRNENNLLQERLLHQQTIMATLRSPAKS